MPWYRKQGRGKILEAMTDKDFQKGMTDGHFCSKKHRGFSVLVYYSGVRRLEALRPVKEQFQITETAVFFDVLKRLKHGIETPPLKIPRDAAFVEELVQAIQETKLGKRVFPYSKRTAYNIIDRVFNRYPHFFRLSRITNFFAEGWTIAQVKSWTGLTLQALNYYVGLVDIAKMGESLGKVKRE